MIKGIVDFSCNIRFDPSKPDGTSHKLLVGAASAAPTMPFDTDLTHLHVSTAQQARATGQRRDVNRLEFLGCQASISHREGIEQTYRGYLENVNDE